MLLAYNEESNIANLLNKIQSVMDKNENRYEVVVVNDGSTDNTKCIVESYKEIMPIQLLNHEENRGVGRTFFTGISHVCSVSENDTDILITMEGDNSNDPIFIPSLIHKIHQDYQVVIASRFINGGGFVGFPRSRYILTFGLKILMKLLFPIKGVRDYSIFYRAYNVKILKRALDIYKDKFIQTKSFVSVSEILLKLRSLVANFSEVPHIYRYDLRKGSSKMEKSVTIKEYLKMIYLCKTGNRFIGSRHKEHLIYED